MGPMAEVDSESVDVDYLCRRMNMASFVETLSRLPYSVLVYVHSELGARIDDIDYWLGENTYNRDWAGKARAARRNLAIKFEVAGRRVTSAKEFALARVASRCGGVAGIKESPAAQVQFLVGLVDRLLDHGLLDRDEAVVIQFCRDTAMSSLPPSAAAG